MQKINIQEFRELGYLQELNRIFLHPLGLALEVIQNADGTESLGGIWDAREDPQGIYYDLSNPEVTAPERLARFQTHQAFVAQQFETRVKLRQEALGFVVEPIPESE